MASMTLDQMLFDTPEPERSALLAEFLQSDDPVLLKPSHMTVKVALEDRPEVLTFPPRGKRVGRKTAVEVLYRFGREGIYVGKDRATMITKARLDSLSKDDYDYYVNRLGVNINDSYVYHAVDEPEEIAPEPEEDNSPPQSVARKPEPTKRVAAVA